MTKHKSDPILRLLKSNMRRAKMSSSMWLLAFLILTLLALCFGIMLAHIL